MTSAKVKPKSHLVSDIGHGVPVDPDGGAIEGPGAHLGGGGPGDVLGRHDLHLLRHRALTAVCVHTLVIEHLQG